MKNYVNKLSFVLFVLSVFLVSCAKTPDQSDNGPTPPPSKDDYRDFATTKTCAVSINYGVDGYQVPFELFDQNPFDQNLEGEPYKKDIEPLFRAYTNNKGVFVGDVTLPETVTQLWLSSDATGSIGTIALQVINNTLQFDQQSFIESKATKASTEAGYSYPDDFKVLGSWADVYGTPTYLSGKKGIFPASFVYSVDQVFTLSGPSILELYPDIVNQSNTRDLVIKEPTKMSLTFMRSTASLRNVIGYYTYETETQPTVAELSKIIAFPNVTPYFKKGSSERAGSLFAGDQVQLEYWDGTGFTDVFPAGVSVGFCVMTDWFKEGNIKESFAKDIRYSNPAYNKVTTVGGVAKQRQHAITMMDKATGWVVVGIEDNIDFDYTDVVFAIDVENKGALGDVSELPSVSQPKDVYTEYKGSLAFEDLWPYAGDYDMNDVVIYYKSRVYQNGLNEVTKTVDEFTLKNNGAALLNGFGYQFHKVTSAAVRQVKYAAGMPTSSFMKGQSLEPGQECPTIILFDNIQLVKKDQRFTVEVAFNSGVSYQQVIPPYNPFVISNTNDGRGQEVHLSNYPPTSLVNKELLGKGNDVSLADQGIYYVTKDNSFPFAIHIANLDFVWPTEGVKISDAYPDFTSWATTQRPADWYTRPRR